MIKDSGERREFESGAVRDIGKGRCDLLPIDVLAVYNFANPEELDQVLFKIHLFQEYGMEGYLFAAIQEFAKTHFLWYGNPSTMLLEVSEHFAEGANKYGENNWQKGIPCRSYIDSAVRHLLKWRRGDKDEPHDRAFVWNLLCCIWTCRHLPELNDYK